MEMALPNDRLRSHAVGNNGGVELTVIINNQTLAVIKLTASELEDMVKAIDGALKDGPDEGGNSPAGNGG